LRNVDLIPQGDDVLSSGWLSEVLERSPEWRYGSVQVLSATRIGIDHGMSGRIHRVTADTKRGGSRSLVVKQEGAEAVERELLFRSKCAEHLRGSIPDCYAGVANPRTGRGVLVLEDIQPAEQGDVLGGCSDEQAKAAVSVLARLHSTTRVATNDARLKTLPRWRAVAMESDEWADRLARASQRFPEIVTPTVFVGMGDLPEHVPVALDRLRGPVCWMQVDTHLDNVLFRPNGTAVLLDWCNAAIGPPAADLCRFLSEGIHAKSRPALVSEYGDELRRRGVETTKAEVTAAVASALLPVVQSAVGWAGSSGLPAQGRAAEVCGRWLLSVVKWWSEYYGH